MPIPAALWVGRMLLSATAIKNTKIFRKVASKVGIDDFTGKHAAGAAAAVAVATAVAANPQRYVDLATAGAGPLVESLARLVSGLNIPTGTVSGAFTGVASDKSRVALGGIFSKLLDETLQLETVKEGYLQRTPGHGERTNMERMVGAAFRMQLGDMLADFAGKKLPFGVGNAFSEIAERIDKAINLDDAIEEIIQVPMQAVISRGLEAFYNRQLKPADLSASEALKANIANKLGPGELGRILDNAGYRDDIRQILRDNAAGNLTESDLNDGYQWNLLTRDQVKQRYRDNAFEEPDAELKTKLVEGTRRQKLREKIFELYGNLYRDGVVTKQEVTPFLENYGYDADEVEMWFSVQELERRQRKWISDGNILKLIKRGEWTTTDAINYQVLQGMEANDAFAFISLAVTEEKEAEVKEIEKEVKAVVAKLPAPIKKKCEDLLKPEDLLTELLGQLTTLIPGELLGIPGASKLKAYIECALKEIVAPPTPTP